MNLGLLQPGAPGVTHAEQGRGGEERGQHARGRTAQRAQSGTMGSAQFRQAGIKAQFFGFDRLEEDAFVKNAGSAAEGTTAKRPVSAKP